MAVLLLVTKGRLSAYSAAIGGAAAFIPAILYVGRMLAVSGNDPRKLLAAQYRAEAFKIVGTAVIFGATFIAFKGVVVGWMFGTYFLALLVYWAALLFDR
jgi:ATP synthase protein I